MNQIVNGDHTTGWDPDRGIVMREEEDVGIKFTAKRSALPLLLETRAIEGGRKSRNPDPTVCNRKIGLQSARFSNKVNFRESVVTQQRVNCDVRVPPDSAAAYRSRVHQKTYPPLSAHYETSRKGAGFDDSALPRPPEEDTADRASTATIAQRTQVTCIRNG